MLRFILFRVEQSNVKIYEGQPKAQAVFQVITLTVTRKSGYQIGLDTRLVQTVNKVLHILNLVIRSQEL